MQANYFYKDIPRSVYYFQGYSIQKKSIEIVTLQKPMQKTDY